MKELIKGRKLTVFVGGDAREEHRPLYDAVIDILRQHQVGHVSLLRGAMSYHGRRVVHSTLNEITMGNLPIIIEAIDLAEKIKPAAEEIAKVLGVHGLVQTQPALFVSRDRKERNEV